MRKKDKFSIHNYLNYISTAIFILAFLIIIGTIVGLIIGIPWLVGIVERLVEAATN